MLNIIAKKYSLPLLNCCLLNKKILYKKHKSVHDLFKRTINATQDSNKQPNISDQEKNAAFQSDKEQSKIKIQQKIREQRLMRKELREKQMENGYLQDSSGMIDDEWYGNTIEEESFENSEDASSERMDSFFYQSDPNRQKVSKFMKNISIQVRMQKSTEFTQTLTCLLDSIKYEELLQLLRKYISEGGCTLEGSPKIASKEKQLFKNVRKLLCKCIEDDQSVNQILQLFSKCNPKFIEIGSSKKFQQPINFNSFSEESPSSGYRVEKSFDDFLRQNFQKREKSFQSVIDVMEKNQKLKNNEIMELIQNLDEEDKKSKTYTKKAKLFLKKQVQNTEFQDDQSNLQKVEKKIFGNKKLVTEQIVFKRVGNKTNQKKNNFGDNWVYCYELPYELNQEGAQEIINIIQKKYGPIQQYSIYPYKNILEKNDKEIIYVIPENYKEDSKKSREKIIPMTQEQIQSQMCVEDLMMLQRPQKKTLTTKILEKTKKSKELGLNKSYILFKFKNKEDKDKFLTPEMRLFGLNLGKFKNIRFQDGQAKNMITLTMIPWGCQSQDIIRVVNQILLPLKITVTHPNCLIAKSYIFIETANFYEAYYAKDLLNNLIFQNQRLKCQIIYGSAQIIEGEYKHNLQTDHYETLVQRLSNLRSFHEEIYN